MKDVPVSDKRNIALMGHTHSGKTTLLDAIWYKLGLNDRLGSVDNGSSVADYNDEEKGRKITLFSKSFSANYTTAGGKTVSLSFTDTPGYMDFFGQMIAAVHVADAALIVVDAVGGIQVGTHRAWKCCNQQGIKARGFVITGIDRENGNYARVLESIQATFGKQCVPVEVPLAGGAGVVDALAAKDVPPAAKDEVEAEKAALIERAAETNDSLIEKFLGGEELTPDEVARGLVDAVATGGIMPVFACAAPKGVGLTELLEEIARLFPGPDRHARKTADGAAIGTGEGEPFVGQVWRMVNDPFAGQLAFVRVMGGTLRADSEVYNASKKQKERVGAMLLVNGKKQEPMSVATAGDIVAIPKLKFTGLGDTLCAMGRTAVCAPMKFPKPVTMQAMKGKTQADDDKLGTAAQRVCDDDPTLHVERNTATHEMVLMGLGDVHLDVAVELMKSRSHVDVLLSTPKVPYRETVTSVGEGHYKHKKQSGGRGQYGEVYIKVQPKQDPAEDWFEDAVVGGVIPHNFIPAVQKGLVEGMTAGALAGFPVADVKVTLYDGSYHDVDSSEIAFKIAASRALKDGMLKARPVLLEPIMSVKVFVPDHCLGDINGDLNHKRGRIHGMETEDGLQVILADVPQSELFRYAAELRSITAGQGTFEMEFSRYEQVPGNIAQKVVAEATKDRKHEVED
ncbi:MAG: elongation factor G [Lentisphaerae bacterium]|nr:elongation factor G [Lentisphaerota bacterium]